MSVSIIVPIFKVEEYLDECIGSIINQDYKDIQIILIDDGSPDMCGAICDRYAESDPRITVIHKTNGGLSDARNAGMSIATGKYILFVDSDDYLEKNAVSQLVEFSENNNLDILMFDAVSFGNDSIVPISNDAVRKYIANNVYAGKYTGAEFFVNLVDNRDYRSPVQYFLFRHDFILSNNLIFHYGILHEDEEFTFLALLYADRVMHLPRILYHHRLRDNSIMSVGFSKRNTDSLYEIIFYIINNHSFFKNDSKTSTAYITGIGRLAKCFMDLKDSSDRGNSQETLLQFRRIKNYFVKNEFFDNTVIKGYFVEYRKKHSIYNQLKHYVFSHKWSKNCYFAIKRIIKH